MDGKHSTGYWLGSGQDKISSDVIALKMSEIIYAQAIRTYLSTQSAKQLELAGDTDNHLVLISKNNYE